MADSRGEGVGEDAVPPVSDSRGEGVVEDAVPTVSDSRGVLVRMQSPPCHLHVV